MKNFNKKLTLVVALASIISSPVSAGFLPARGLLFTSTSLIGRFQNSVSSAYDSTKYNVRNALGFVTPVEQAKRELGIVGTEIKDQAILAGIDAVTDILSDFLPESLRKKINTKNLVKAAGALTLVAMIAAVPLLSKASSDAKKAVVDGVKDANAAVGNVLHGINRRMNPIHVGPDRNDLARIAKAGNGLVHPTAK